MRLWQVEFKVEDLDRLGPRLYRRGLHGPKTFVKTKLGTQDVAQFTVHKASKTTDMDNFLRSLDRRHWITTST